MPLQAVGSYWKLSRAPRYSVVFAIPLLVIYEALAALISTSAGGMRNGADVLLRSLFYAGAGRYGPLAFGLCLIGVCIWVIGRDMRKSGARLQPRIFAGMLAESVVLAAVFGVVIGTVTARLLTPFSVVGAIGQAPARGSIAERLMLSLGAGLYEELLFRVIIVSGLLLLARRVAGWGPALSNAFAVGLGALIFSAFHYVGPLGDPLRLDSFVFRTIAGVAFSALYVFRGFGITAWTHAIYDIIVLVL